MTVRLLPLLLAELPRVATMSSGVANSKLADLMFTQHLAVIARERGWKLMSIGAHPGYTRTNLQTAGPILGRDRPAHGLLGYLDILPSQGVEQGAEPLLYAATSPDVVAAGYYGPSGRFGLVGPTAVARPPRRALEGATNARLWAVAEHLTGATLPTHIG